MSWEARVIHFQCRMGFHCIIYTCLRVTLSGRLASLPLGSVVNSAALYILARVAWRTCADVSAEWLPGSRTSVSERARVSRFNVQCQVVV